VVAAELLEFALMFLLCAKGEKLYAKRQGGKSPPILRTRRSRIGCLVEPFLLMFYLWRRIASQVDHRVRSFGWAQDLQRNRPT
jgi:hypothetical protein